MCRLRRSRPLPTNKRGHHPPKAEPTGPPCCSHSPARTATHEVRPRWASRACRHHAKVVQQRERQGCFHGGARRPGEGGWPPGRATREPPPAAPRPHRSPPLWAALNTVAGGSRSLTLRWAARWARHCDCILDGLRPGAGVRGGGASSADETTSERGVGPFGSCVGGAVDGGRALDDGGCVSVWRRYIDAGLAERGDTRPGDDLGGVHGAGVPALGTWVGSHTCQRSTAWEQPAFFLTPSCLAVWAATPRICGGCMVEKGLHLHITPLPAPLRPPTTRQPQPRTRDA